MIVKMAQFRGKLEQTTGSDDSADVVLSVRIDDGRLVIDVYKNRFGATCADALGQIDELAEVRARAERLGSMLDLASSAMTAVNEVAREAFDERDAALARAADSDARLVRAIDAAKAAALAVLEGRDLPTPVESSPELSDEERGRSTCGYADCPLCEYYR